LVVHSDRQPIRGHPVYVLARPSPSGAKHESTRQLLRDNAHAESFWSRLKTELLDDGTFPSLAESHLGISHFIAYYNAERRHPSLGDQSPNPFEILLQTTSQFCAA
jgi:putative transposase